jgi:hypothetical protein
MSILRWKQKVMLADHGVLRDSGGGGGGSQPSGPTQTTAYNTNIPEYAQPYVMNMLNAAQAQIYTPDMTGFNPYTPYSYNPTDYVAGFSPLQQQAQSSAANLQTPGQYAPATGIAGRSALGSLGTARQAGMAGANLAAQSTNPYAVGAYMNPFLQNALAPSQQLLNQQYGMQGAAQQGAATQAGAFGGSRNALMQGLNEQNRMLAQNQLVGNAYQNAYDRAQQQMNQVAGVGLQGQQTALQGYGQAAGAANTLAGIGGQELAAQQGIIGTQTQQGAAQQGQQQQIINQAVQNYATAQQYPMLQLGMLNSMLRGLPMQSTTTSLYQAQPTATQQAIGLGGTAAMLGSAFGKREGGIVGMREGGKVPGFKYGAVINDAQLEDKTRKLGAVPAQPGQLSPLQQRIQDPQLNPNERMLMQGVQTDQNRLRQNPAAAQMLMQAAQPPQAQQMDPRMMDQARLSGLGAAGGTAFNGQGFAGGGIIAFADEGLVPEPKAVANPTNPEEFAAAREAMMTKRGFAPGPSEEEKAALEAYKGYGSDTSLRRKLLFAGAQGFAKVGTTPAPGGLLQALNMGVQAALPGIAEAYDAQETAQKAGTKAAADLKMAQRKFAAGDVDEAFKDYDSYMKNKTHEKVANIQAGAAGRQGATEKAYIDQLIKQGYSLPDALQIVKGAGRAEGVETQQAKIRLQRIDNQIFNLDPKKDAAKIAELEKQAQDIILGLGKPQPGGPQSGGPQTSSAPDASGIVDIPGKGKFKQLPNGNYVKVG